MDLEQREDIIRGCIESAQFVLRTYNSVMVALRPTEVPEYSDSVAEILIEQFYKIIKLTAVYWPEEYEKINSILPFGLLFGWITDERVLEDFCGSILRGSPVTYVTEYDLQCIDRADN